MHPFAQSAATPQANRKDSPLRGDSRWWLPDPNLALRAALFAILGAMLASGLGWWFLGVDVLEFVSWLPSCAFRSWTGVPCPGCGMGHALIHLSRLQGVAAVGANPAAPFLAATMLVGALRDAPDVALCGKRRSWAAVGLALVLIGWLWRILPVEGSAPSGL